MECDVTTGGISHLQQLVWMGKDEAMITMFRVESGMVFAIHVDEAVGSHTSLVPHNSSTGIEIIGGLGLYWIDYSWTNLDVMKT